jgi:acyl transferase domain-containing protein/acyl carrier protein
MDNTASVPLAIVGLGSVLPDAPNVSAFWDNVRQGRSSISEVPPDRWDPAFYYDPDPRAPDKTYSKIGGWVRVADWEPAKWRLPVPPRVSDAMDGGQRWAVACTVQVLNDYGYPSRPLDLERTAVILGNAMGGEQHYRTTLRACFPEYAARLTDSPSFAALPESQRRQIVNEWHRQVESSYPHITEDSMPGELSNCIAGRIANLFNFRGPNFTTDAACASTMAAFSAAAKGLAQGEFDVAVTGGVDRNMAASMFIKFAKIGALSASGSRPYADGADGFVMGEGAVLFLLKRLADAERAGDKIYAVLLGIGASSDGKGKGITAPNPIGQRLAIGRAWTSAGVPPDSLGLVEGHGTSTAVGDVVEVESMASVLREAGLRPGSIALGSVKSNIGHLKAAAGAAGLLKVTLALHEKVLPPSINFVQPNRNIDFTSSPFYVNTEAREWKLANGTPRRACASAFGFGGTNFHCVLEEYVPGRHNGNGKTQVAVAMPEATADPSPQPSSVLGEGGQVAAAARKAPLRGALVIGGATGSELLDRLASVHREATEGRAPKLAPPDPTDLGAPERVAIDFGGPEELADRTARAIKALQAGNPGVWKLLKSQGIFRGNGPRPKVAFLYPGQGSQYVNMLRTLGEREPIVASTFAEADEIAKPLLGKPLTEFLFVDSHDAAAVQRAEEALKQTSITQPAVLTIDLALTRLLAAYGIEPDVVMGHSLGEYGALQAAGALPFADAVEAVSARGREMTRVAATDHGKMAAVFAPLAEIERVLQQVDGYVVIANVNSHKQAVIGGATAAVERAIPLFQRAGYTAVPLSVSHAFHTSIVAAASEPLRAQLGRLRVTPPKLPIISNVTGEFYPTDGDVHARMLDLLAQQVAAPVQFIKGLHTLHAAGVRIFVEVGPKRALQGFVDEAFGDSLDVAALFTNHPKLDDATAFNQALCGLYAAGLGQPRTSSDAGASERQESAVTLREVHIGSHPSTTHPVAPALREGPVGSAPIDSARDTRAGTAIRDDERVVITGASLGLPGTPRVFDDENIARILRGEQFITPVPESTRKAMVDKRITRLVKTEDGAPRFEMIEDPSGVLKLAGRAGRLDLTEEFGVPADRVAAFDSTTCLAIGSGLEALRDAGLPLVQHYKTTSRGTKLPDRWGLPEGLRDETGVIFASAFAGLDALASEMTRYHLDRARRDELQTLERLRTGLDAAGGSIPADLDTRVEELRAAIERDSYMFDRRFVLRVLSMGHSQFAEYIGARGPNTQVNAACASGTQAVALAQDWIRLGRCRRVVVVSADNVTSDNLLEWLGTGFLASGAAATTALVEETALPFDRRRHGMIVGMGAAAMVLESLSAAHERGLQPICEVLGATAANSAFHGTRLNVEHIREVMESLVRDAESRWGIDRHAIAPHTVFVSHETYTPARGGSASAEVNALRHVFGEKASEIVVANTKGYTGHAMGAGLEDVTAVKMLETGIVPPVANYKEIDPDLGPLKMSQGGTYPVQYALRLAAGFGSQICMSLLRWTPTATGVRRAPGALGYDYRVTDEAVWKKWLTTVSGQSAPDLEVVHRTLRVRDNVRRPATAAATSVTTAAAARVRNDERETSIAAARVSSMSATASELAPVVKAEPVTLDRSAASARIAGPAVTVAPAPAGSAAASVQDVMVALVAEKTGYSPDVLDIDLDLETDLRVDTVKAAEIIAALRAAYQLPRDEVLNLRDFSTMRRAIQFVLDRRPDLAARPAIDSASTAAHDTQAAPASSPVSAVAGAAPSAATTRESVRDAVVSLVVEKTGYPADMLDLDLDLEADLGVDTVKQAELLAAIRGIYQIPRDESLKLRDFPTLNHVIKFVLDRRPELISQPTVTATMPAGTLAAPPDVPVVELAPAPAVGTTAAAGSLTSESVRDTVVALVVEKTGYPADMLDLDLDLEADLGVDTVKQAELLAAIRGIYEIPRDESLKLRDFPTLSHVIKFVLDRRPDLISKPTATAATPAGTLAATPETPVVDLTPPPAVATTAAAGSLTSESVRDTVVALVVEKTGYPADMLDLDLDLEADLGVDTVKQAELLAAIRGIYEIPRDEALKLRDFPTLNHVIRFVLDRRAPAVPAAEPAAPIVRNVAATGVEAAAPTSRRIARTPPPASFDAADRVPRRVPVPMFRPPARLCQASGVVLGPSTRVLIAPDTGGAAAALAARLSDLGVETLTIDTGADEDSIAARVAEWAAARPIDGLFWLPALDDEGDLGTLTPATWREALRVRVKALYAASRALYGQIDTKGRFLLAATRLGGQHGYDAEGAFAPLGGAVTGFVKAFSRERPEALVKAVDFAAGEDPAVVAYRLIEETLRDRSAVDVGYKNDLRWTIGLADVPAPADTTGLQLSPDSVFVITGAAGSIVSAITVDLAVASGGRFFLLDRVPEPDPANPDIARLKSDKAGLRRDLAERLKGRGEKPTPAMVERELAALERAEALLLAIRAISDAGGTARYLSADLTDAASVARAMDVVRGEVSRIDVLVHAAGVEVSHFLPDKKPAEFNLVFDVKSDGWFHLLHGIGQLPVAATVVFSSISGRFGNGGQTDYAAANDLLCKITSSFRRTRPDTRALAIDWTAWKDIGMASRGSIPKTMEAAGIEMLPPEAGVTIVRRELTRAPKGGEVVIALGLGVLLRQPDSEDLLDRSEIAAAHGGRLGPMVGAIAGMRDNVLTVETTLDPSEQPFLNHHRIDGTAVLPGVMGIEAFAEVASLLVPGWVVTGVEDITFASPFKFYKNQPRTLKLEARFRSDGADLVADCRLIGWRQRPGRTTPQENIHFVGRVRLSASAPDLGVSGVPDQAPMAIDSAQIYRIYFHGPAYQVIGKLWLTAEGPVGQLARALPANHVPGDRPTLMSPRLIESCFQAAGMWEIEASGRMALPHRIERVSTTHVVDAPLGPLYAVGRAGRVAGAIDAVVVDSVGRVLVALSGYRTAEVPEEIDKNLLREALAGLEATVGG